MARIGYGNGKRLPGWKINRIRELTVNASMDPGIVAQRLGINVNTVIKYRDQMKRGEVFEDEMSKL